VLPLKLRVKFNLPPRTSSKYFAFHNTFQCFGLSQLVEGCLSLNQGIGVSSASAFLWFAEPSVRWWFIFFLVVLLPMSVSKMMVNYARVLCGAEGCARDRNNRLRGYFPVSFARL
jgi:hypothetical protein